MKAYFYCRVAHDDSFSLERQAEELRRYAEQAGYTIVGAAAEHGSGMTLVELISMVYGNQMMCTLW